MEQITIKDILTDEEIERAKELYREFKDTGLFAKEILGELILPNIERINEHIGQENSPLYLAYAVEYILQQNEK